MANRRGGDIIAHPLSRTNAVKRMILTGIMLLTGMLQYE